MQLCSVTTGRILDEIRLGDVQVTCIIGIYPEEALRTQLLTLQLSLFLDTRKAAEMADLSLSVDYAALVGEIQFLLKECKFGLLETAAEAVLRCVLAPASPDAGRTEVEAAMLEISKPEALAGMALPSLRILRRREDYSPLRQRQEEIIFATPDLKVLRYTLEAGETFRWQNSGWKLIAARTVGAGLHAAGQLWSAASTLPEDLCDELCLANKSLNPKTVWCIARRDHFSLPIHLSAALEQQSHLSH